MNLLLSRGHSSTGTSRNKSRQAGEARRLPSFALRSHDLWCPQSMLGSTAPLEYLLVLSIASTSPTTLLGQCHFIVSPGTNAGQNRRFLISAQPKSPFLLIQSYV